MIVEVKEHLTDPRWSNVISLVCALLPSADEFLRQVRAAIGDKIANLELQREFDAIQAQMAVPTPYSPVATQRCSLAYVFSQLIFEAAVVDSSAPETGPESAPFRRKVFDLAAELMKDDVEVIRGDVAPVEGDPLSRMSEADLARYDRIMAAGRAGEVRAFRSIAARLGVLETARLMTMLTKLKPNSPELEVMLDIRSSRCPVPFPGTPSIVTDIGRFGRNILSALQMIRLMLECLGSGCVMREPSPSYLAGLLVLLPASQGRLGLSADTEIR